MRITAERLPGRRLQDSSTFNVNGREIALSLNASNSAEWNWWNVRTHSRDRLRGSQVNATVVQLESDYFNDLFIQEHTNNITFLIAPYIKY